MKEVQIEVPGTTEEQISKETFNAGRNRKWYCTLEDNWTTFYKINTLLPYDWAIYIVWYLPKEGEHMYI